MTARSLRGPAASRVHAFICRRSSPFSRAECPAKRKSPQFLEGSFNLSAPVSKVCAPATSPVADRPRQRGLSDGRAHLLLAPEEPGRQVFDLRSLVFDGLLL